MSEMKAVLCHDFGNASVEEIPKPAPLADEVLVEVKRVQLSITECDLFNGIQKGTYEVVRERIENGDNQLFGHEFCGTVVECGADVERLTTGDRVYSPGKIACQTCVYCKSGYRQFCENREIIGRHRPGALAEYVALPVQPLARLPDGVSDAEGAAMQPMASSLTCAREAAITTGDVVVVLGAGVMGYQTGQFALQQGAGTVIAVDVDPEKLDIVGGRGMTPIDASAADVVEAVRARTDGIGADVVFEAVGGEQESVTAGDGPLAQAFDMVRPGGTVVQIGHVVGELAVEPKRLRSKEVRWVFPTSGHIRLGPNADTGSTAAEMVADGRVSISEYITHELEGLESFEEAVEITTNKQQYGAFGPAQIIL